MPVRPARLPGDGRLRLGARGGLAVRRRTAAQALFAAAAAGDPEAIAVRDRFAAGVADAVRVLCLTVDPRPSCSAAASPSSASRCVDGRSPARCATRPAASPFLASLDLAGRVRVVPADYPVAAVGAALLGRPMSRSRCPGLVDLQVNGAAGIDLTAEPDRLWEVAAALPAYGVTAFVPTVITCDPAARARRWRRSPPARRRLGRARCRSACTSRGR